MKIGPKYKIARKLGAPVFEKTQTQKFVLSESRKSMNRTKRGRPKSDFGLQLIEKQKSRYSYVLSEKQFSNYVKKAISKKEGKSSDLLYENLETRLDNTVYRLGLTPTRLSARQAVSHGHITVNGKKVDIPSFKVSIGDKIKIKESSLKKGVFNELGERLKSHSCPAWLKYDEVKKEAEVLGLPSLSESDLLFDINAVIDFYSK